MLEVGSTYEYEYMHKPDFGPPDSVVYFVKEKFGDGSYVINFCVGANDVVADHTIYDGSPMVELSEKVL